MKSRLLCLPVSTCLAAITLSSCLIPMSAGAASFRWDPGLTPLTPSGGNGPWDITTANWSNGTGDVVWPNATGDFAVFGGAAGAVTVGTPLNANRLVFNTTGYSLGGADITLSGNTPQLNANAGVNATVSATLTFAGTDSVTKTGGGKISLTSAATSYSGATLINGGIVALETTGALPSGNTLTISNGELSMAGSAAVARAQTVGTLNLNPGRDVITLTADATRSITFNAASLATRAEGSSIVLRGTALGTAAPGTAGSANILFDTAPTVATSVVNGANSPFTATGSGTLGTTEAAVLRGVTVNTSPTGLGVSFATYDPAKGVRALSDTEHTADYTAAVAGDNVAIDLTAATSITGKQTNTLQVNNSSGSAQTLTNSGTALMPANGLLFTGTAETTLTGGSLTFANTAGTTSDMLIYSSNTGIVNLATTLAANANTTPASRRSYTFGGPGNFLITSNISSGSNGGFFFNGPGNVELRCPSYGPSSAGTVVNGGTVSLGTGFALSSSVSRPVYVANGATFDINNITLGSTPTSGIDSLNNINGYGGTVTNSGGAVTNLTLSMQNGGNADFQGTVSGNINLVLNRQGNGGTNGRSQKFTAALTYVGSTAITSASTTSTADVNVAANPTAFMIIGGGGSLPSGTDLTLGGKIKVNDTDYGVETTVANGNGVLTLGDTVANTGGPVNQTVASLATGLSPGPVTAILGGAATTSTLTVNGSSTTTFAGKIGGTGTNNNNLALVRGGTGSLTLAGVNTYIGDTTISNPAAKLALSSTGALSFIIGANGANNKITGVAQTTGTVTLAGTFNFDLTAADPTVGNSWQIVNTALLPTTTFTGLSVTGFTGGPGVWTKPADVSGFNWVFRASTGALTYEAASGGGGSYATWAAANGIPGQPATGDFESDGITNLIEYALGTSPTVSTTPAGTYNGTVVSFKKGGDAITNGDVSWIIQESDDLGISDPWAAVVTQPAGDPTATISYTLPAGKPKVFVRLVVRQN